MLTEVSIGGSVGVATNTMFARYYPRILVS
jgi:hypothetical protein